MDKEYWDSCLLLAFLQDKPEEQELVDIVSALLRRAEAGETLIVVSTLVLAEIRPVRAYNSDHAEVFWDLFHTSRPYVKVVSLSPRIAELAATIGSEHQISSPDAIHVATAWSEQIGKPPLSIKMPARPPDSQLGLH